MAHNSVQPLRISKPSSNNSSPSKMNSSRPLSEISPMGIRRNSPSWNSATKNMAPNGDSSPFDASPSNNQTRLFWKGRDSPAPSSLNMENEPYRGSSPSPTRRTSLEKLQQASRVKNSNMFARESSSKYDPANTAIVDRPLASGRPLSLQFQGNAFDSTGVEQGNKISPSKHRRSESQTAISYPNPTRQVPVLSKAQLSPHKSSLSSSNRYAAADNFDTEEGTWSEDEDMVLSTRGNTPRAGLRQQKTVSFDQAPPQINEYEMITPDPSSVASDSREGSYELDQFERDDSFERESTEDHEDSFDDSLEDTGKTPVVLPEDWRFMSPEAANKDLAETFDDPFKLEGNYSSAAEPEDSISNSSSIASASEVRPLPPIPNTRVPADYRGPCEDISTTPAIGARRNSLVQSPPRPASVSKADILKMRESPMPLDERLRLLELQGEEKRRAEEDRNAVVRQQSVDAENRNITARRNEELSIASEDSAMISNIPPRISRESILRNMNSEASDDEDYEDSFAASAREQTNEEIDYSNLDPDIPIPSRESSSHYEDDGTGVMVKREEDVNGKLIDMYSSRARGEVAEQSPPHLEEFTRESSVIHHELEYEEGYDTEEDALLGDANDADHTASYTDVPGKMNAPFTQDLQGFGASSSDEQPSLPSAHRMSLPEFTSFGDEDFGLSFQSYISPSPPDGSEKQLDRKLAVVEAMEIEQPDQVSSISPAAVERPATPQIHEPPVPHFWPSESFEEEFATPESVIHRPFAQEVMRGDSPGIPDSSATIKAPGSKLKTRASITPTDVETLAAHRRQVSGERPPVPDMPEQYRSQSSESSDADIEKEDTSKFEAIDDPEHATEGDNVKLELPLSEETETNSGLGIDQEFDRLLEAKKKGYLMRQNTKVIIATNRQASNESKTSTSTTGTASGERPSSSSRGTRSAGNSPQKQAGQTWTAEPWNGRMRRHSTRKSDIVPGMKMALGAAPPIPGEESNAVNCIEEEGASTGLADFDATGERGRLFVKVVGVKGLDLPLPTNDKSWFQLTLDNGLHCVTTAWLELGKAAPIGQEFELTVFDELEFQLTLQTKLERPQSQASSVSSLGSPTRAPKKASALSRLLISPRKRREQEKRQQEEDAIVAKQRQDNVEAQRANIQPTAWDLLHDLVGPDGSFARAYVSLKDYERQAFGRPYGVEIPCFNEWAVEDNATSNSTRSKMGGVQRKPPYKIGKLDLQLLFVPKPRGVKDEDMPQSMSACVKQLKEAENTVTRQWEGHLSQQGGDCPYWRRRFFKLNGANLTSYHESTRQRRANINLAKAVKLIDDRSSLTKAEGAPAKKGRRKSAFAEEEEGYMFVEEGFRIRFANGEVIDFYADNRDDKEGWMKALTEVVGKDIQSEKMTWARAVLAREKDLKPSQYSDVKSRIGVSSKPTSGSNNDDNSRGVPTSPQKSAASTLGASSLGPPPVDKSPRHQPTQPEPTKAQATSPMKKASSSPLKSNLVSPSKLASPSKKPVPRQPNQAATGKRQAVRSMIF